VGLDTAHSVDRLIVASASPRMD